MSETPTTPPTNEPAALTAAATSTLPPAAAAPHHESFIERLKRHKVAQWTLAYAAAAYTLLHGVEMLSDAQEWPHVIVRVLSLALILGVPIVATFAWYHGVKGLKRISGPELLIVTALLFIAGSLLWAFSGSRAEKTSIPASAAAIVAATPPATALAAPRTAVAVLPFANLTGDSSKNYLGEGMANELINALTMVPGLKVPARTSSFAYEGHNTDIRQIAKDLGVGTILEGSVQTAGTQIRIGAELINAQDGTHIWSQTYDRMFTDLFKLQDDLAKAIARALQVSLNGAALASVTQAPPTRDVEAYQLLLQGESLLSRLTEQNLVRGIDYFQQALARDPKFARAYADIAYFHDLLALTLGLRPLENFAAAERAAQQALDLDPSNASAQAALALVYGGKGRWVEAETHYRAALSLDPNDATIHVERAIGLKLTGHVAESLNEARQAFVLAPASANMVAAFAVIGAIAGSAAEPLKYADLAVAMGFPRDTMPLAVAYEFAALRAGRFVEANAVVQKTFDPRDPDQARTAEVVRLVYAALANPAQRTTAIDARTRLYPRDTATQKHPLAITAVSPCIYSAVRYGMLGVIDVAYDLATQCLDQAVTAQASGPDRYAVVVGDDQYTFYLWSRELRAFRQDRRFQAFVTRLGLMEYYQQYGPPDGCDLKDGTLTCH